MRKIINNLDKFIDLTISISMALLSIVLFCLIFFIFIELLRVNI